MDALPARTFCSLGIYLQIVCCDGPTDSLKHLNNTTKTDTKYIFITLFNLCSLKIPISHCMLTFDQLHHLKKNTDMLNENVS